MPRVAVLYAALAALGGVLAILWLQDIVPAAVLILIPAAAAGLWYYVLAQERARHSVLGNRV